MSQATQEFSRKEIGHVYHQFTLRILNGKRDALQAHFKQNGIDSMIYYAVLLSQMKVFQDRCEITVELKEAEKAAKEVLSLPMEPLMNEEDIHYVCTQMKSFSN